MGADGGFRITMAQPIEDAGAEAREAALAAAEEAPPRADEAGKARLSAKQRRQARKAGVKNGCLGPATAAGAASAAVEEEAATLEVGEAAGPSSVRGAGDGAGRPPRAAARDVVEPAEVAAS